MTSRFLLTMKLTKNFAADLIGGAITAVALFALLCWEFSRAMFSTLILGRTEAEQLEELL